MDADVVIVGAGVAGLRCALECQKQGLHTLVLEASDGVGGRIRTDKVDGFLLDRGFQVLLTAYTECEAILDYEALELGTFEPGALIWNGNTFEKLVDPWRRPTQLLKAAFSPVGSLKDKLKVGKLRGQLTRSSITTIQSREESSTLDYLKAQNFSDDFIEGFFRPFYGGIFLEQKLDTTQRMFEFVFKMFGQGYAALPRHGMQAIPEQMAQRLKPGTIRLQETVIGIQGSRIDLADGSSLNSHHIVLATDMTGANKLLPEKCIDRGWNAAHCYYFAAPENPLPGRLIALNGTGKGSINNIAIPSDITPGYSEGPDSLICVSTKTETILSDLSDELQDWFGPQVRSFKPLKIYTIPKALPRQLPGDNPFEKTPRKYKDSFWVCGDFQYSSSIQGAMASGRLVAESILMENKRGSY